jgi:hypothetical protein
MGFFLLRGARLSRLLILWIHELTLRPCPTKVYETSLIECNDVRDQSFALCRSQPVKREARVITNRVCDFASRRQHPFSVRSHTLGKLLRPECDKSISRLFHALAKLATAFSEEAVAEAG